MTTRVLPACCLFACCFVLGSGCASASSAQGEQQQECADATPKGSPEQFTFAGETIEGVRIQSIEQCGDPSEGYIRLVPEDGTRILTLGRNEEGGVDDCTPDAENPTTCPHVIVDAFYRTVIAALAERGIETVGFGLGACGDVSGGYEEWNVSVSIHDWSDSDEAVEVLAQKMAEWDVQNHAGLSLKAKQCKILLE